MNVHIKLLLYSWGSLLGGPHQSPFLKGQGTNSTKPLLSAALPPQCRTPQENRDPTVKTRELEQDCSKWMQP